jgi:hypothetical protein
MEKRGAAREDTDNYIIRPMRFACWVSKAHARACPPLRTRTRTHSHTHTHTNM